MTTKQSLFTIAPDAPFLATLVERVLDGTLLGDWPRSGPFWLSDVTIVLPTRRSKLALAEAFLARGQRLLPDIRTFGGEAGDEEPFLPPVDAPNFLPQVTLLERRLILAQLIDAWAKTPAGAVALATPPNAAEILALADSFAELVDDLALEQVPVTALRAIAPENLAANWQETLKFLDIVLEHWPQILEGRGKTDAVSLRNERLRRQALAAPLIYGEKPIIAAGSTGSVPATAALLAAVTQLPRGVVVLPGLDTSLDRAGREALQRFDEAPQGHPQFGLVQLLGRLSHIEAVELASEPRSPRTTLVRRALALPEATAQWVAQKLTPAELTLATQNLAILAARTEDEEARAIALAARDGLARGQSVGIITPDRNLARRIAAELGRFDIKVDDSAGTPLFQTAAGRLARQILVVAVSSFAPIDLMALLQNGATHLGYERIRLAELRTALELGVLRGQRPAPGLAGLRTTLAANVDGTTPHVVRRLRESDGKAIGLLLDRLDHAITPVCKLIAQPRLDACQLALALLQGFGAIVAAPRADATQRPPGTAEFEKWAEELIGRSGDSPSFPPSGLDSVLHGLMAGIDVRPVGARRTDIAIWGELEARLQNPDLAILAGLNEDIWPEPSDAGPWLSRGMRLAAGLEPPERRAGLVAHDFEMALGNEHVLIAFAERLGTSPALPSRLVQRLEAFIGRPTAEILRRKGEKWRDAAHALDAVPAIAAAPRPSPNPPASLRPRRLSITEIETLFRSPYDLYARHVLRLRKLDGLGEDPGMRERGSMIHEVFARFIIEDHDIADLAAIKRLNAMASEAFAGLDAIGERRDIWLRRFETAAEAFLEYERGRHADIFSRHAEIDGEWLFPDLDNFKLTGRADRVDRLHGKTLEITDFKTGSIPTVKAMQNFDAPQLLLEAAMARAVGLKGVAPAEISGLTYIKIGLGPDAFTPTRFKPRDGLDLAAAADEVSRRMQRHVDALLLKDTPMCPRVKPDAARRYRGDYDHLARTDEWTLIEGEDAI
jgi:ATP-dependent helicase/nuclease subunit B